MTLPDHPVAIPRLAFAYIWQAHRPGPAHPVIGPLDVWIDRDARATMDELVTEVLTEAGIYDRDTKQPLEWFRNLMHGIVNSHVQCYVFSTRHDGHTRSALAVPYGMREAAKIIVENDEVTIYRIHRNWIPESVFDELPSVKPAEISAFSVLKSKYNAEPSDSGEEYSFNFDTGKNNAKTKPVEPADQLRNLMASRRTALHQLYVSARLGGNTYRSVPISAVDTVEHGRVVTYDRTTVVNRPTLYPPGNEGEIVCGPGSERYAVSILNSMIHAQIVS